MIRWPCFLLLPIVALVLGGCVTQSGTSLSNVQREVASRGGMDVAWPQTDADKCAVDQSVAALLKADLTPESAAAIAVLNSRKLRATFEELGISQAELIAAARLPNPSLSASVRWPNERPRPPNVEFNLGIDLLTALLLPLRKNLAGEQLVQAEHRVAHEALSLAAEAKSAAYTVQARQEFRTRLAAILDVNDAAGDLAQRQFDAGNINRLELLHQQSTAQDVRQPHACV